MDCEASVRYLYGLGNEVLAMKLGLENIRTLLAEIGDPHKKFKGIQIAGTNGKGSVCAYLESICLEAGLKAGTYTSPHLVSVTERVRIAGAEITEEDFARHATAVREAGESIAARSGGERTVPTFFEQVTAIAALAFAESKVDIAILETGLGGRFDATTALDAEFAVITRVDLDHQEWLGSTVEKIAAEKAAIIRPWSRTVVGLQRPEAMKVILERCEEVGVPAVRADVLEMSSTVSKNPFEGDSFQLRTKVRDYQIASLGLVGVHQVENAVTAVLAAECLAEAGLAGINETSIGAGLRGARHAGRLELVGGVLLDGAHNESGVMALREFLSRSQGVPLTIIFGAMREKDISKIGSILFPCAERVVAVTADSPRALPAAEIAGIARASVGEDKVSAYETFAEALDAARAMTPDGGLICVTGSLYLVGEARRALARG
jgi:dihydrofolate synthase/folylpolyglutamate synthase